MKVLVTGCAGFIGSHLSEALLDRGHDVVGVDAMTDFYPRALKRSNLAPLLKRRGFRFIRKDINRLTWTGRLRGIEAVFHLAGQPGVRSSWGRDFDAYIADNVAATQRLLENVRDSKRLRKFVFSSSSSVYGETAAAKVSLEHPTRPYSPYGVTKLAAENLCSLYAANFSVPVVALRLFTVYGPRQRPDMSFVRLIRAALTGKTFNVYGDGSQQREFTYVADVVGAMLAALKPRAAGIFNVGGGSVVSLRRVIRTVEELTGRKIRAIYGPRKKGDVYRTSADISASKRVLGYRPRISLREGLMNEIAWVKRGK